MILTYSVLKAWRFSVHTLSSRDWDTPLRALEVCVGVAVGRTGGSDSFAEAASAVFKAMLASAFSICTNETTIRTVESRDLQ